MLSLRSIVLLTTLLFIGCVELVYAQNTLLYGEAQGTIGYSNQNDYITYTHTMKDGATGIIRTEAMQKPSLGLDWVQKISNEERDIATLSFQCRVAYLQEEKNHWEAQVYNAWIKYKSPLSDIWVGHGKPASGASYWLDNHALLLPDMSMYGFIYDRDWGGGTSKDTNWGNLSLSLTTASGMKLYSNRNYLMAGHVSYGVLNQDNYTIGATVQHGKVLETAGYHIMHNKKLHEETYTGIDVGYRYNNLDSVIDTYAGTFYPESTNDHMKAWAIMWRTGVQLLPEEKLKLEGQLGWWQIIKKHHTDYATGLTWKMNADWAIRVMYDYHVLTKESKTFVQVYYYKSLL